MLQFVDMHCHPSFLGDAAAFVEQAAGLGMGLYATTVTPEDYAGAKQQLADATTARVGVGLHPWWVSQMADNQVRRAAAQVCAALVDTRYVGEVGLDFGKRWKGARERQVGALTAIAQACGEQGGKLLSIHAVRSADAVLDVLEETSCLESCDIVFHWYSDSSAALTRAIRAGCLFSVNLRMLATKRGREYARVIPADRLLLETDLPPEDDPDYAAEAWLDDLRICAAELEALRDEPVAKNIFTRSLRLLNWE